MKRVLVFCLLLLTLSPLCQAAQIQPSLERLAKSGPVDQLDVELTPKGVEQGTQNLWERGKTALLSQVQNALSSGIKILIICGICSIATAFTKAGTLQLSEKIVELAGICLLILSVYTDARGILNESRQAVEQIGVFSKILLPTFATWGAAAGKPLSAMAMAGGAMVYTDLLCSLAVGWIFPMIMLYIFVAMAGHIGANSLTQGIGTMLKSGLFWIVKLALGGITFYLTLSGAIAAGGDGVSARTAKAISGVVPVVGSAIAGAAESVLAGAGAIRNTVGAVGIIAIIGVVLLPFVRLAANMIIFRCAAFVASSITSNSMARCVEVIAAGYAMAMGLLAAACGGVIMAIILGISVYGGI